MTASKPMVGKIQYKAAYAATDGQRLGSGMDIRTFSISTGEFSSLDWRMSECPCLTPVMAQKLSGIYEALQHPLNYR